MAIKCLNCGAACTSSDPFCPWCKGPVRNTDASLIPSVSASKMPTKYVILFVVIGSAVYNTILGPKLFPSGGDSRLLGAALAGGICAVAGAVFGMVVGAQE